MALAEIFKVDEILAKAIPKQFPCPPEESGGNSIFELDWALAHLLMNDFKRL